MLRKMLLTIGLILLQKTMMANVGKPALIPLPQSITWNEGHFSLASCKTILVKDASIRKEAERLRAYLKGKGFDVKISAKIKKEASFIELMLDKNFTAPQLAEQAYELTVAPKGILLRAETMNGIFNGLQTLQQVIRNDVEVSACKITDWPSFSWRGFMVDVGRNYQTIDLLKQQIDIMAQQKLNVFHFHPTEDIAWRLAIKKYPQLTEAKYMIRDKGKFYTEAEIKELIRYCKERYITFVPEIDMPGHSAAFKHAMKVDMQSDSGLLIVKNILREFCETYDVPYIHIGADEVKITNKQFVPEVTAFIESFGKKVIGWEPGGNFTDRTIRQMWMEDITVVSSNASISFIDSRHLYLNHMDPLEAVVTIFNRRLSGRVSGDENAIGATLCVWNDRAVSSQDDLMIMNPVYPGMLAFAERSWRGGGRTGWTAKIGEPGSESAGEFAEFENRLMALKQLNFSGLPFPYTKQTDVTWKFYGPYNNDGDVGKVFEPETTGTDRLEPSGTAVGGTIIWRHWWAPLIAGVLKDPQEKTTWYATTKIWSDEEKIQDFWIGFYNISRSQASDSPKAGTWDSRQSKVWVNGKPIAPPEWKSAGQQGHLEIPLVDEGYEYRAPAKIKLQKGWNEVLIKSPINSFKGENWNNPEKWMFTFIPVG